MSLQNGYDNANGESSPRKQTVMLERTQTFSSATTSIIKPFQNLGPYRRTLLGPRGCAATETRIFTSPARFFRMLTFSTLHARWLGERKENNFKSLRERLVVSCTHRYDVSALTRPHHRAFDLPPPEPSLLLLWPIHLESSLYPFYPSEVSLSHEP